jgi:hypothetical protein
MSIICPLRSKEGFNKVRRRVLAWTKEAVEKFGVKNVQIGPVTMGISDGKDQMEAYLRKISRLWMRSKHVTLNTCNKKRLTIQLAK